MIFAYRCDSPTCRQTVDSTYRGDALGPCPTCATGILNRKWSVNVKPAMQEHFNETTQTVVRSMSGFKNDLKRAGDEYSQRTGIDVDYQPRDWADAGATEEGMDHINAERDKLKLPPLVVPT